MNAEVRVIGRKRCIRVLDACIFKVLECLRMTKRECISFEISLIRAYGFGDALWFAIVGGRWLRSPALAGIPRGSCAGWWGV